MSSQVSHLSSELELLPKYALLAAGFISYLSGASEDVRQQKMAEWCEKLHVPTSFDFCRFLSTESEQLQWKAEGLPSDSLSIENALVILQVLILLTDILLLLSPCIPAVCWTVL